MRIVKKHRRRMRRCSGRPFVTRRCACIDWGEDRTAFRPHAAGRKPSIATAFPGPISRSRSTA